MTNQQIADEALAIFQANRDDQVRIDRLLREFFSEIREQERTSEFKRQMSCVFVEFPSCVTTSSTTTSVSPSLSSDHF